MHILHICSDYSNQKLYYELISNLDKYGIEQTIYVPVRTLNEIGKNEYVGSTKVHYIYSYILSPHHRIFFKNKIKTVFEDLKSLVDLTEINFIHTHYLFSDGAVAVEIKKEFGIPFITAVRSTDLNYFFPLRPDLRKIGKNVINESIGVIFLSELYKKELQDSYLSRSQCDELNQKSHVIPNGLSSFWHMNTYNVVRMRGNSIKIIYVGSFIRRKNLDSLLEVCRELNISMEVELTLVGGGGFHSNKIHRILKNPEYSFVKFVPWLDDQVTLRDYYRANDIFVMISQNETFGLVFAEALSQGLPIVYSKTAGIHGHLVEEQIGKAVDPTDLDDIRSGILQVANDLELISGTVANKIDYFNWQSIAKRYIDIYQTY